MQEKARQIVVEYFNQHVDVTDGVKITINDVYIVWFSKTLQNWKFLISSTLVDGMIYEITYNGDNHEWYIDAYKKFENRCIKDWPQLSRDEVCSGPTQN